MPTRDDGYFSMENLPLADRLAMDKQWQAHWYRHIGTLAVGKTALDVGAGTGYGLPILRASGVVAVGFDVAEISPKVPKGCIEDYASKSFDWALAIDVIEHVQDDKTFLKHLLRVAREAVFITTPNWNVSKAENPYHVREYTPLELRDLLAEFDFSRPFIDHRIWVSNHVYEVTTRERFEADETWHNFGVLLDLSSVVL